jgi:hypothetical protein
MERKDLFNVAPEDTFAFVGGGDGQMILDHETVFVCLTSWDNVS